MRDLCDEFVLDTDMIVKATTDGSKVCESLPSINMAAAVRK